MPTAEVALASPVHPARVTPPVAPAAVRHACLLSLIAMVVGCALLSITFIRQKGPDFEYFYRAGESLLVRGTFDPGYDVTPDGGVRPRGMLDWYLPFVHRLMTPLAALPFEYAGYVWMSINIAALFGTLWMLGRHVSGLPPQDWPVTQFVPFLVLGYPWVWEMRLNQINALTLVLMVGSFVAWQSGRRGQAGLWIGLAALLKVTPGLLIVWFALKRQWRTVAVAALTLFIFGPLGDLISLGRGMTVDAYTAWVHRSVATGSHTGLILNQREMDWRNQALGAVLSRWLHPTSYSTRFDNDPRVDADYREAADEKQRFNIVALPRPSVALIVNIVAASLLATLVWIARRPADRLSLWQMRGEYALFMLGMLLLMPVMRLYHVIWAMPALCVLGGAIHYGSGRTRWSLVALSCIAAATALQLALFSRGAQARGTVYLSILLLAAPLVAMLITIARRPTAIPHPDPPKKAAHVG